MKRFALPVLGAVAACCAASPGLSDVTTFATYNVETTNPLTGVAIGPKNFQYNGDGTPGSVDTLTAITTDMANTVLNPNSAIVSFAYSVNGLSGSNIDAYMTFNNLQSPTPHDASKPIDLTDVSGTITFTPITAGTINGHAYTTTTNLLTVALVDSELQRKTSTRSLGGGTGAVADGDYDPSLVNFSSDLLSFDDTYGTQRQASLSYTSDSQPNNSPSVFQASSNGSFASNPVPVASAVPETATWAMMLFGFGAVGGALRTSRNRKSLYA